MEELIQAIKEKLEEMYITPNPHYSLFPQLLQAMFNEDNMKNLGLTMSDENDMEQEIDLLMRRPDKVVIKVLVPEPEDQEELARKIKMTKSENELQEILIMDVLYEKMMENGEWPPRHYLP